MRECISILPPRCRSNTRSDQPTKRADGSAFSRSSSSSSLPAFDFQRDLPERAALLPMEGGDVLQHEPELGDDIQNAGEAAGDLGRLDLEDLGNLHDSRTGL